MRADPKKNATTYAEWSGRAKEALMKLWLSEGRGGQSIVFNESRSADGSGVPAGPKFSPYEAYEDEFQHLLMRLERDVARGRKGGRRTEDKEDRNQRIVLEYEGWDAARVAVFENLSVTQVRTVRQAAGMKPKDGVKES